ncbi:MAG: CPBP family intramembrane glutamic endopeptidase [Flavobacterium psychrophilum]
MFIEQAIKKENKFWKYLIGSIFVILASSLAQIPLVLAVFLSPHTTNLAQLSTTDILNVLDSNLSLFLMSLTFVGGIISLYFVVKWIHKQSFRSLINPFGSIRWSRFFFAFGLWASVVVFTTSLDYLLHPTDYVFNLNWPSFILLVVVAGVMLPLQTSCEELIFRGYLMQGFGNLAGNKWFPLLLTSLIFGGMHIFNPEVEKMGYSILIYYIGTGLLLGIFTLLDDGIELAMGFHAANNLIGALLVTSSWSVFQTHSILKDVSEPEIGFDVLLPVFIIYPLILLVLRKKYKWTNWKEKLTGKFTLPN